MDTKRVLITGATGIVGKWLIETQPAGFSVFASCHRNIWQDVLICPLIQTEIADKAAVLQMFKWAEPEVVIHAAGENSVDFVEKNQALAQTINLGGTQNVIEGCRQYGTKLIYISSNAVFEGNHPPYAEDSERKPVNYYGHLKVEAENLVLACGLEHVIVRGILTYGWPHPQARGNLVTIWLEALSKRQPVKVVDDRFSQPLFAQDFASAIWQIVQKGRKGIYHLAGLNRLSLFEFAIHAAEVFGLDTELIEPVPSSYFQELAPRPVETSFSIDKAKKELSFRPLGTKQGLERMKLSRPQR